MALKERNRAVRGEAGKDPYNLRTYKVSDKHRKKSKTKIKGPKEYFRQPKVEVDPFNESERRKGTTVRVISRTHIPKERVNQKERLAKKKEV